MDVQVQGYPTIKFFVDGKASDYDGPRSADGIVDFMLRKFRNVLLYLFRLLMKGLEEDQAEVVTTEASQEVLTKEMWLY